MAQGTKTLVKRFSSLFWGSGSHSSLHNFLSIAVLTVCCRIRKQEGTEAALHLTCSHQPCAALLGRGQQSVQFRVSIGKAFRCSSPTARAKISRSSVLPETLSNSIGDWEHREAMGPGAQRCIQQAPRHIPPCTRSATHCQGVSRTGEKCEGDFQLLSSCLSPKFCHLLSFSMMLCRFGDFW